MSWQKTSATLNYRQLNKQIKPLNYQIIATLKVDVSHHAFSLHMKSLPC